ncbi:MAG: sodium/glutamate symporter [Deltaproteobacteria bacterium]|nr:MAG: sodium/glutamate symporter [Deltaproteobacteria bacterium]
MTGAVDATGTLALAMLVLFGGSFVIARVSFLRENNIPVPVVGGILFALITAALYTQAGVELSFDMELRNPMMLAFFTTIGLGANLRMLARGGPQLLVFGLVCLGYLIVQNGLGVAAAVGLDLHPLVGMLSGSITLSGGHGTGAAFAQRFADVQNLAGAMELAMACATFGLIIGGIIGGPVAGRLIKGNGLTPSTDDQTGTPLEVEELEDPITTDTLLQTLFWVVVCLVGGGAIAAALVDAAFTLPSFIWSLFLGVVIRNAAELTGWIRVHRATVDMVGTLSLSLFLAMALMALRIWELVSLAGPLLVLLAVQALGMAGFAYIVTFRALGRSYDAAIIAGGHCGFGMGATPTAVANMEALTNRFGPSPQAFLVVPLMGAFFIDLLNAIVIQTYLALPVFGF